MNPECRAAVSSFGFSGTNAHLIVESAASLVADRPGGEGAREVGFAPRELILPISAPSDDSLRVLAARWRDRLASADFPNVMALVHTAQVRGEHQRWYRHTQSSQTIGEYSPPKRSARMNGLDQQIKYRHLTH